MDHGVDWTTLRTARLTSFPVADAEVEIHLLWYGVKMAPFPDEVDVFTGPHWRMKQLVGLYCEKV